MPRSSKSLSPGQLIPGCIYADKNDDHFLYIGKIQYLWIYHAKRSDTNGIGVMDNAGSFMIDAKTYHRPSINNQPVYENVFLKVDSSAHPENFIKTKAYLLQSRTMKRYFDQYFADFFKTNQFWSGEGLKINKTFKVVRKISMLFHPEDVACNYSYAYDFEENPKDKNGKLEFTFKILP